MAHPPSGRHAALDFWYDFGSTYSYPAVMRIAEEAEARGVDVDLEAVPAGADLRRTGPEHLPLCAYPVKGAYMWRDLERLALNHRLPFKRPPEFPQNGLLAARIALVLDPARRAGVQPRGVRSMNSAKAA